MKITRLLTACITVAISTFSFGQSDKEIRKTSALTCDCLEKKDLTNVSSEKIQMELGLCMIEALSDLNLDISLTDEKKMEEIGGKIGLDMVVNCPSFIEVMGTMMSDDPEGMAELMEDGDPSNYEEETEIKTVTGKLNKINHNQFISIDIEDKEGKVISLYWFEYFPTPEPLRPGKIHV